MDHFAKMGKILELTKFIMEHRGKLVSFDRVDGLSFKVCTISLQIQCTCMSMC